MTKKLIDCNIYQFTKKYFPQVNLDSWIGLRLKARSNMSFTKKEDSFWEQATNGIPYDHKTWIPPQNECDVTSRQTGKSLYCGIVEDYNALSFDLPMMPGRLARNVILAPTVASGTNVFDYASNLIESNESLSKFLVPSQPWQNPIIRNRQQAFMKFSNNTTVEILPSTRISARGLTVLTLCMDELGHFNQVEDSRFSDIEVFKSAMPALSKFGSKSQVILSSTPFEKIGLLWQVFKKWWGVPNPNWLVFNLPVNLAALQISTGKMTIEQKFLDQQQETDPAWFAREFLAQFPEDSLNAAFNLEAIMDCTVSGRQKLAYNSAYKYFGFIRPASLSVASKDEYTIGIAHCEGDHAVIDVIKGWAAEMNGQRYTPDDALSLAIQLFKSYRVREIEGDKFGTIGLEYKLKDFEFVPTKLIKSDLYLQFLEILNSGLVELLDDPVAIQQLKTLQIERSSTGRDRISANVQDRQEKVRDERAQVICGLVNMARSRMNIRPTRPEDVRYGKFDDERTNGASDIFGNIGRAADDFREML